MVLTLLVCTGFSAETIAKAVAVARTQARSRPLAPARGPGSVCRPAAILLDRLNTAL